DCFRPPSAGSADPLHRRHATWRAAKTNLRGRSTNARRARRHALPTWTARPRANHAPATFQATAAGHSPASCPADDRTVPRSSPAFVILRDQPVQQAHAEAGPPALVDLGLRRSHRGPRDIEMRPWRIVDETLQELRRRDRAAVAIAGVLHVGELRIDLLVIFRAERHAPDPLAGC